MIWMPCPKCSSKWSFFIGLTDDRIGSKRQRHRGSLGINLVTAETPLPARLPSVLGVTASQNGSTYSASIDMRVK